MLVVGIVEAGPHVFLAFEFSEPKKPPGDGTLRAERGSRSDPGLLNVGKNSGGLRSTGVMTRLKDVDMSPLAKRVSRISPWISITCSPPPSLCSSKLLSRNR